MTKTKEVKKRVSSDGASSTPIWDFNSRKERLAAGEALRETVPREHHAAWQPTAKRRDPIDVLEESNRDRVPELVPIR